MDVARPAESGCYQTVSQWVAGRGVQPLVASEAYHCFAFLLWSVLLARAVAGNLAAPLSGRVLAYCVLAMLAFSGIVETLQYLNPVRCPLLFHAALNVVGGLAGFLLRGTVVRAVGACGRAHP
jgi:hypothetical protein